MKNEGQFILTRLNHQQRRLLIAITFAALSVTYVTTAACALPSNVSDVCEMSMGLPESMPMTTIYSESELFVPTAEQLEIIGRLAKGIHQWKTTREHGWWECGEYLKTGVLTEDKSILLAYRIVKAADKYSDETVTINPWGLAATMAHESSFDRCAVGFHYREWAISKNLMQRRRRSISYGQRELHNAMNHPRSRGWFTHTGIDVGYCQLLTRFYEGPHEDMMDPEQGIDICASQFRYRAKRLRTARPWRWWRGHRATWYDDKVTIRARALGAHHDEI